MPIAHISIRPSDFSKPAGRFDGSEDLQTVVEASFAINDFAGKGDPATQLRLELRDSKGSEATLELGVGKAQFIVPSEDGKHLMSIDDSPRGVSATSKFGVFMLSLVKLGLDESKLSDDITILAGGVLKIEKKDGGTYMGKTIRNFVATEIDTMPWDAKKEEPAAKPAKKGRTKKTSAKATDSAEVAQIAREAVAAAIADNPDGVELSELLGSVFEYTISRDLSGPVQKAVTNLVHSDKYSFVRIGAEAGLWSLDDDTLTAA